MRESKSLKGKYSPLLENLRVKYVFDNTDSSVGQSTGEHHKSSLSVIENSMHSNENSFTGLTKSQLQKARGQSPKY